ncbi:MAG: formylglycine-generating enzyme family protein [Bacteroidaceae bacterium]|nr:formylglycine-generating enzyme family protein [Bacteroidaceae bacterium]
MKKFLSFAAFTLMLAATCVSFTACGGDDDDEKGDDTPKFQSETITLDGGVSFKMIAVEGGTFLMGSPESDADAYDDEKPQHEVTLSNYYIGETEVTQELWEAVMGSNPSDFVGANLPVENVSWDDCQAFINKLNEKTGKTFRLPTEAEWEYAARGGKKSKGYTYSGSNAIGDVAWHLDNSGNTTHEVGTKQANELGIYDMSGNVWEWCQDWYGETYYENSSTTDPQGPASGTYRMLRGGSWIDFARNCRVAIRVCASPDCKDLNYGLRLVLAP